MKALSPHPVSLTARTANRAKSVPSGLTIELLEPRIAPAAVFTFTDVDGDIVTIKTSLGTDSQLAAVVKTTPVMGLIPNGQTLDEITLTGHPEFNGTDVTVKAVPGPDGGDGLVNLRYLSATDLDLGKVVIDGDLAHMHAGKTGDRIESISVHSISGANVWGFYGDIGTFKVKTDLRNANIALIDTDSTLGTLKIGGSLVGGFAFEQGFFQAGTIDRVTIGGDIRGGAGTASGYLVAANIGSMSVGGSIIGGDGITSGAVLATSFLESISVAGDVVGADGNSSGTIRSNNELGVVKVAGSVLGGKGMFSGTIQGELDIGKIKIGGNLQGGSGTNSGTAYSPNGGIAGVQIGGSLNGGDANQTGAIFALGGDVGPIKIAGDLHSVERSAAGVLLVDSGVIFVQEGTDTDVDALNIASIQIGGSVIGASSTQTGQIMADGTIGPVSIGGDLRGGMGYGSGGIGGTRGVSSVSIGGSVIGAAGQYSGSIDSSRGRIGDVTIAGSLSGGADFYAGYIDARDGLGDVHIGRDLVAGTHALTGYITTEGPMGKFKVDGSIIGNTTIDARVLVGSPSDPTAPVIKSIKVRGNVEHAVIQAASDPNARIGAVTVEGNWVASSLSVGATAGADGQFGTADDEAIPAPGEPDDNFSKIASIVIGGHVFGTNAPDDHFGFVSQTIGSFSVNGVVIPLVPGPSNDVSLTEPHFVLGATRDVTIHEIS